MGPAAGQTQSRLSLFESSVKCSVDGIIYFLHIYNSLAKHLFIDANDVFRLQIEMDDLLRCDVLDAETDLFNKKGDVCLGEEGRGVQLALDYSLE